MKSVVLMIAVSVITVSALEFKKTAPILPPVDGQTWNGSAWVVK